VASGVVFYAVRMVYVVTLFVVVSSLWWFLNGLIVQVDGAFSALRSSQAMRSSGLRSSSFINSLHRLCYLAKDKNKISTCGHLWSILCNASRLGLAG